ncbi:amidinotransferase [Pseudoneurospora amorphoporcata]|uniref:Glycine amidinotransferase, mitochondrial n=1 Tax=Pseudoneurospora amorphoporcata TaxID=241081 RepID=A0AAN6NRF4_9PEZI|nr:amidinotransferase [Pseudoneurospora amorphoporcata]
MVLVKELEDPTPPNNIGNSPTISASNEWSPLHTLLIGRASHSLFPSEPPHMIRATMPSPHHHLFYPHHRFPASIVAKADEELDNFARVMTEKFGIKVYRPREVDWDNEANGYTGAMPRDGLMVVGRTVVEACFAWGCRREEVDLAFGGVLEEIQVQVVREVKEKEKEKEKEEKEGEGAGEEDVNVRICRAPKILGRDTIYDGLLDEDENGEDQDVDVDGNIDHGPCAENGVVVRKKWAINNTRPAFDCADFMRFGTVLIGQLSHVTNPKGVDYLRAVLPSPYTVELLNTTDDHAMHIDATILPLRHGTLIYCPLRVTEEELRRHEVFRDWELRPLPWNPEEEEEEEDGPPMYMCSKWLVLNALSVNETTIVVEERQERFARWLEEEFGMEVVRLPFRHVNSLGGSFHCATVDLVRGEF